MRKAWLMAMALTAGVVFGQGAECTNCRSLGGPKMSNDERAFLEQYPAGTNSYGRTYAQQREFESSFAPDKFLGFVFGNVYERYGEKQILKTPFRLFDTITLYRSDMNRLCLIKMQKDVEKITLESAKRELDRVANLLQREYQIGFRHWASDGSYHFNEKDAEIDLGCVQINGRATSLFLSVRNKRVSRGDAERKLSEDVKGFKDIDIPEDVGAAVLSATEPEVEPQHSASSKAKEEQLRFQANQQYWEGWPRNIRAGSSNYVAIVEAVEDEFKVSLVDMSKKPKWKVGEGRSCIKYCCSDGIYFAKYDADGRLVLVSGNRSDFEELRAFDKRRSAGLREEREAWAAAKGITYDEAMSRTNEWLNANHLVRPPLNGGLRRSAQPGSRVPTGGMLRPRRIQRQQSAEEAAAKEAERLAQVEQERQQREAFRAEQRKQLEALQDELKRVREAKAAVVPTEVAE